MHSHVSHHVQTCIIDGNWGCWAKIWKTCRLKPSISYSRLNVLEPVGDTGVWLFKGHISSPCDRSYSDFCKKVHELSLGLRFECVCVCLCVLGDVLGVGDILRFLIGFQVNTYYIYIFTYVYIYIYDYICILYQVRLDITSDEFVRKAEQNWGDLCWDTKMVRRDIHSTRRCVWELIDWYQVDHHWTTIHFHYILPKVSISPFGNEGCKIPYELGRTAEFLFQSNLS